MSETQANKQLVWRYWQAMERGQGLASVGDFLHADVAWHGFQPLRHLHGAREVGARFWEPLAQAMPDLIRRPYVFLCGKSEGGDWVCGTGEMIGTFVRDWLGIPASRTSVRMRFGEFCKIQDGRIVEVRIILDLPALMRQTGIDLVPPNHGRDIWVPGPATGDGVLLAEQDPAASEKSLRLVEEMIFGGLNKYDQKSQDSQGLERFWHPTMVWHGPAGVGSAYGMDEFKKNAQGPIVRAFPDRKGVGHKARVAEGFYAASTGWPSLGGTHVNAYMDWPPTGERIGWNIMDFWRRDGDRLLENWVMIDLIGAALESKVDLLARLPELRAKRQELVP
jgi:ketosteroid isomerase-like protein